MGQKDYVAKILVRGTDIEEYYAFDQPLKADEIRKIWIQDVRDNRGLGPTIAPILNGNILVERLWTKHHSEQPEQPTKTIPSQRVEEVLEEGNGQT